MPAENKSKYVTVGKAKRNLWLVYIQAVLKSTKLITEAQQREAVTQG
ncbi:MAG: hypothetical protein LBL62_06555 [Planctomycetaceae bacterium]|nr:hypothetical protein [Planctomycetaceae bacterium]